jgi:hypothetical protein
MELHKSYLALLPAVKEVYTLISLVPQSKHVVFDIDDTIIFDDYRGSMNHQIVSLLKILQDHGYKIHLVTARHADMRSETERELRSKGIKYDTLALCPGATRMAAEAPNGMAIIAQWKYSEREKHKPVLSIGDQWGDMVRLTQDEDIDLLDKKHNTKEFPWHIVKPNDGVTTYGLKLMAPK